MRVLLSYCLSAPIGLKLVITYRPYRCVSGLYIILSHIDFNHFFLVVTIDCYQCLMMLIVGVWMGFNMVLKFILSLFYVLHLNTRLRLEYYKHVKNFTCTVYSLLIVYNFACTVMGHKY